MSRYDEPDDNKELDNIFPSKNTNDVNNITESPDISRYNEPHDNMELDPDLSLLTSAQIS